MKFQLVSDSSCDLGREEMERLGVAMVSYYVAFEDEVYYREERDIPTHQFYQMMADRPGVFPKTSMPTLEDYLEAFRPLAAQGQPILCICLNANFSGSFQTALNAAEELREEYPGVSIRVMDSTLATVLQGLLVEEAAALRDAGFTLDEAAEALAALPATGRIFFTTSDLEYLRHGGRIGRAAAATGALLKVKPLRRHRSGAEEVAGQGAGTVFPPPGAGGHRPGPVPPGHRLRSGPGGARRLCPGGLRRPAGAGLRPAGGETALSDRRDHRGPHRSHPHWSRPAEAGDLRNVPARLGRDVFHGGGFFVTVLSLEI